MDREASRLIDERRQVTPPVRGRDSEVKQIADAVSAVARGRGGVLIIEGPPGIGKTRLLAEAIVLAKTADDGRCLARPSSTSTWCRSRRFSWRH